jgi:hypothetical protein
MLEHLARALAQASAERDGKDPETASGFADKAWTGYLSDARAALNAIREPDDSMRAVGGEFFEEGTDQQNQFAAAIVYGAMIEATLGSG